MQNQSRESCTIFVLHVVFKNIPGLEARASYLSGLVWEKPHSCLARTHRLNPTLARAIVAVDSLKSILFHMFFLITNSKRASNLEVPLAEFKRVCVFLWVRI